MHKIEIQWLNDVEEKNYPAALSYLGLIYPPDQAAYSGAIRTPIPALPGQSFRDKPDTDSAINQPF